MSIIKNVEREVGDHSLARSIFFGPTALTHIRRLVEAGGLIVTDTAMAANTIDAGLIEKSGARVLCLIDDPKVVSLAEQRRVTRAEIAVDYALTLPGLKLVVVGSAPAAINRILTHRQREPLSDVCVLAAPTGFAGVVQMKERLMDSDLSTIVVRGKKGGVAIASALVNAILREVARG